MDEPNPSPARPSFSLLQRWSIGLNVGLSIACVLALIGMFNYLGLRYSHRAHWAEQTDFSLSSLTTKVLDTLTNDVKVVVFFDPDQELYDQVEDLLTEYRGASRRIQIDTIDYKRNKTGAELLKAQYHLGPSMVRDMVIFDCEGRREFVFGSDLSDMDLSKLLSGESREIKRIAFKGEQLFTTAIASVASGQRHNAYFVGGHGEHDPGNNQNRDAYGKFVEVLRMNNVRSSTLNIGQDHQIPRDCDLLVVAGPDTRYSPEEIKKIEEYLAQGGRLLVLLHWQSKSGLENTLADWGVDVGYNIVSDPRNTRMGADIITTNYTSHPILRPLEETPIQMVLPRSIARLESGPVTADGPQVTELVRSGESGVAHGDFTIGEGGIQFQKNPFKDKFGQIPLITAVEGAVIPGVIGSTRILVAGDSMFLNNEMIESAANRDFAISSVNWLMDRTFLLGGIGPKPIREYRFQLTRGQMLAVNWVILGVLPGAVLLLGVLVWVRRMR